jgi:hypothetical protein
LRDPIGERWTLDELQDERRDAVRVFEAVDAADVRVIQCRERLRFALKARNPFGIQLLQALRRQRAVRQADGVLSVRKEDQQCPRSHSRRPALGR